MLNEEKEFLEYLDYWLAELPAVSQDEIFSDPKKSAILSVDMTNAFCKEGPLSSPRVAAIIPPIVDLLQHGWQAGVHNITLLQDCHTPDALEFDAYAPHALCGSEEAETVDEIKALPFYEQIKVIAKNSVSSFDNTGLDEWIAKKPGLETFVVVGDCTDICVYLLAINLRTKANAYQRPWRVIVPEDCTATYDLPLATAKKIGATPHPGDLLNKVFLYHMALNGVEVVKKISHR
jgi:nicotinamidase-related amidase